MTDKPNAPDRRRFLASAAVAAVGSAAAAAAAAEPAEEMCEAAPEAPGYRETPHVLAAYQRMRF